jgi:TPR repeat protein
MLETDALLRIAYDAAEAGNLEHARRCYESWAALGDDMCFQALGYMYDVGEGVAVDKSLAMKLYRKAWKRGHHAAASNIAILYREMGNTRTMVRTRAFARGIGLIPRMTPVSSPQSNGMAEAFVRTLKRDYVRVNPRPNAQSVIDQLPGWFDHYNEVHPHRALRYRSPREFIAQTCEALSGLWGGQQQTSRRGACSQSLARRGKAD